MWLRKNHINISALTVLIAILILLGMGTKVMALSQILKKGSQGSEVREVQKYLYELKYLNTAPTGIYGDKTVAAVKTFQEKNGLWADGRVGNGTYNLLKKAYTAKNPTVAKAANTTSAKKTEKIPETSTNVASGGTLKKGSKGVEVLSLQKQLVKLRYLADTPNGIFGNATLSAVKAFQKSQGLPADGIAGAATLEAIKIAAEKNESKEILSDNGDLKLNMQGERVRELQRYLKDLKYLAVEPTGYFGKVTEMAVKEFQGDFKLPVDGCVGEATYKAIIKATTTPETSSIVGIDPPESNTKQVSEVTSSPLLQLGMQNEEVLSIQENLKALNYYQEEPNGIYDEEVAAAVRAFQEDNGLPANGKVDNVTRDSLKKILDNRQTVQKVLQHKMKIYATPWALVHKEWERLQVVTVIDVKTEKSFKVLRYGGYYHADVEPCTAEDTRTMLDIYGGKWSWNRRAVIVELNGKYIAASMNGMPHMKFTVADNNFKGHFCIHFLGSRVHQTRKLDVAHQKMVQAALRGGSEEAEIEGGEDD